MNISYKRIYNGSTAELISHKKSRIITIILMSFAAVIYGFATSSRGDDVNPSGLGLFMYFAALVPLFSCCTAVFKDMHDIPTADVQMSMPLSSSERYISRLLTIVRIWFIPFLLSAAAAFLLSVMFAGSHYSYDYYDSMDYDRLYHSEVVMAFNLKVILWFTAMALFIVSVTVICQCCIGAKAESKYLPVMMIIALSIFMPVMYGFIKDSFADVRTSSEPFIYSLWTFSALAVDLDKGRDIILLLINCLISCGVIFAGMFICRKRDARTVGKPIVFPLFFELIAVLILSLFFVLFQMESGFVVMFIAWLGIIILRIVVSRKNFSFAKVGIWTALFVGYYIVFLLVMYIAFLTGGFGEMKKVPEKSEYLGYISQIRVDIDKPDLSSYFYRYSYEELHTENFEVQLSKEGAKQRLMDYTEAVSRLSQKQNRINGLFSSLMFGSTHSEAYRCTVRISVTDRSATDYYGYGETIYKVTFFAMEETARELMDMTEGVK